MGISVCISVNMSVCLDICMPICSSVFPSLHLYICQNIYISVYQVIVLANFHVRLLIDSSDWVAWNTIVAGFITGGTFILDLCSDMPKGMFVILPSRGYLLSISF